jgi:hypothetical protein
MPELAAVATALRAQRIELPSWAFANTGTRFKVFAQPGVPRTVREKIDDAAQVHRFTGIAPTVAVHIPSDEVDDHAALARYARERGMALGTVNANVFQDDDYRLGSVCNPDPRVRAKAVDHLLECVDIMRRLRRGCGHGGAGQGPGVRRRAGRERGADGRLQHRRPAHARRPARGHGPGPGPGRRLPALGVAEKIAGDRVGGTEAGWGS